MYYHSLPCIFPKRKGLLQHYHNYHRYQNYHSRFSIIWLLIAHVPIFVSRSTAMLSNILSREQVPEGSGVLHSCHGSFVFFDVEHSLRRLWY